MSVAAPQRRPPRCRNCGHHRSDHHYIKNAAGGNLLDAEPCDCGQCPDFMPLYCSDVFDPKVGHPEGIL